MKLSEAIRLGAMLHPQTFNVFERADQNTRAIIATCALGAAQSGGFDAHALCASPGKACYACPACDLAHVTLPGIIVHLNDLHRWTREAIADWVETVERSLDDAAGGREDKRVASEIAAPVRA